MNKLEFNEVMKACEIGSSNWNRLEIKYENSYYANVTGNIPLEVAKTIYKKYPDNKYGIRIEGGAKNLDPNDYSCIKGYHIDTKEGLVIFITEMQDYIARKNNLPEIYVSTYNNKMTNIYSELLKKVDPSITVKEWITEYINQKDFYENDSNIDDNDQKMHVLRYTIDQFDKTVNPYINEDVELLDVAYYIDKVSIDTHVYNYQEKDINNCCDMIITDKETKNNVCLYRFPDGFSYQMHYTISDGEYLSVLHYFSLTGSNDSDKGEFICINYFGENVKEKVDIRYNMTKGLVGSTYGEKTKIKDEQINEILFKLWVAIRYAETITLNNMSKKGYGRY